jgi:pimeloyl-ACP methyl ester carboxylesterase
MTGGELLLVHGAWHGAWCWEPVIERLDAAGIRAVAVELPFTSFEDDVAAIGQAAAGLGPEVVLCGHSYGGRLVSAAAASPSADPSAGPPARARHLVYLSAQVPDQRQLAEYAGRPRVTSTAIPDPDTVRTKYYNKCSEPDFLAAVRRLRPMVSVPGGTLGLDCRPWERITSTYIVCTRDRAITPAAQRTMAANLTYTAEIPADHAAFFSAPDELSRVLASVMLTGRP